MADKWVTVKEASERIHRSHHTIYNWIHQTRTGKTSSPLTIKRSDKEKGKGWLIQVRSLGRVDRKSPRASRPRLTNRPVSSEFSGTRSCFAGGDTQQRVELDRQKWIKGWVDEGKSLAKVLAIFAPNLHPEIERYYWDEVKSRRI